MSERLVPHEIPAFDSDRQELAPLWPISTTTIPDEVILATLTDIGKTLSSQQRITPVHIVRALFEGLGMVDSPSSLLDLEQSHSLRKDIEIEYERIAKIKDLEQDLRIAQTIMDRWKNEGNTGADSQNSALQRTLLEEYPEIADYSIVKATTALANEFPDSQSVITAQAIVWHVLDMSID